MTTHKGDGFTVTYHDDQAAKDRVFAILLKWFNKSEHYSGESIQQCDDTHEDAPGILTQIAEKGFKFKTKWEE